VQGDNESHETEVLIAGGGLVGLSSAAFLAAHGVRSIAVERLNDSSPLPRAAFFHMRTLEMFRWLGIEERVREGSAREFVPEGAITAMDTVSGRKLADIIGDLNEGVEALSPCRRLFLSQPSLEPILRERARAGGAEILQGAEIAEIQQDEGGVHAIVRDIESGKTTREVRGAYLVAADGGHSRVRDSLGIGYEGRGAFSNSLTIYFTADLSPWIGQNKLSLIYVNNPVVGGFFRMNRAGTAGFLVINVVGDPKVDPQAATDVAGDLSPGRLVELIRGGVGQPDLDVRIDGYTRWRATAEVAQSLQAGRIFIAGDAAHRMPPNGGFGGNTGIHDAHNLAWKLAHVLNCHASPELLETYASERTPVARFTVEQAFSRYVARTAPWLQASQHPEPLVDDLNIELGYLYGSPLGTHADPRTTRAAVGSRVPHVWLTRGGQRVSTIDLTGNYLLLAGSDGASWVTAARSAADRINGLRLDAYRVGADLEDPGSEFLDAVSLPSHGALLIRPDGFVAWRASESHPQPEAALHEALRRSLGH
jgi:2-polyprenyl-6-methoxyphenol hydroxylase-like FAD-dependent oxidoreductase